MTVCPSTLFLLLHSFYLPRLQLHEREGFGWLVAEFHGGWWSPQC